LAPAAGGGDLSRALPPGDQRPRPGGEDAGRAQRAARAGRPLRAAEPHPLRFRGGAAPLPGSARRDRAGSEARVRRLRCGSSRSRRSGTRSPSPWRSPPSNRASARSGALARLTARAMVAQLPLARLTLWNRTRERAEGLARELAQVVDTRIAPALESAVRDHRVIVTATASTTPLVMASWVEPGTHITSVGTGRPEK